MLQFGVDFTDRQEQLFWGRCLRPPSAVIFNFVRPLSLGNRVNRRNFIAGLGVAAAWPVVAPAQQFAIPTIGFLHARSREDTEYMVAAFKKALDRKSVV